MPHQLLTDSDLCQRCTNAAYSWAHQLAVAPLPDRRPGMHAPARAYATLLRQRLAAGKDLPLTPSASQARAGLTDADAAEIRVLIMAEIESFLDEVTDDLLKLTPMLSVGARERLTAGR